MKEKDKNRSSRLSDFLRYSRGEMTGIERNAFERELQKDPFAAEAAEGLSEISSEEAAEDLAGLKKQLKTRISRKYRFVYYRIAASVAVLMVIASVFYIAERSRPTRELSETTANQGTFDIPVSKAISEPPAGIKGPEILKSPVAEKKAERPVRQIVPEEVKTLEREKHVAAVKSDTIIQTEIKAVAANIPEDKLAVSKAAVSRETSKEMLVRGKIISSEDNLPLPGVNVTVKGKVAGVVTDSEGKFNITLPDKDDQTLVANYIGMEPKEFQAKSDTEMEIRLDPSLMALQEVVVVGYGTSKNYENVQTGYLPPQPVDGRNNYNSYIEKNIKNPETLPSGQKAVVVVGFAVSSSGNIDSIKVIRSPGIEFSREAIRLIREGPSWKPAEEDGKKIDDEVRVRIVFK
jgi:TonB family protein